MRHHARFTHVIFFFFAVPGIERRGVLPPRYAPGPIFILYFETRSHEVAEGLTKERERERERESERAEAGRNPDPPVSASQSTGITSVRHHARLFFIFETGTH